ncbi:RTA1 like protein [Peniophora sp. CONT]|nr:RTA1 like protein [Peniophora sp. CONT]
MLNGFAATTPRVQKDLFRYTPVEGLSYLFIIVFGLAGIAHTYLGFKYRRRYLVWTAGLCGYLEVLGWIGRLIGAINPNSSSLIPYMLNSLFTLFSPTFLLAAIFMLLRDIMQRLGACYSRLNPRLYGRVFVTCDIVSLWIQGGGGGLSAVKDANLSKIGGYISLVGIIFQLFGLLVFITFAVEYFWRYFKDVPLQNKPSEMYYRSEFTRRVRWLTTGVAAMTLLILVRSVYRAIELAGGYAGKVAATQWLFVVFDAVMIALAIWVAIILHPGWLLVESEEQNMAVRPQYSGEPQPQNSGSPYEPRSNSSYSLRPLKPESA